MNQCQNCRQVNNYGSNFCRFCGTRMVLTQNQNRPPELQSYEYQPPRPYVWKTDEIQPGDSTLKKSRQINQVQPLANATIPERHPAIAQSLPVFRQTAAPIMNYGYRCPRCSTQNIPRVERKISTAGWIVFAALLIVFFPLFWVGFLIKEEVKICPVCNARIG